MGFKQRRELVGTKRSQSELLIRGGGVTGGGGWSSRSSRVEALSQPPVDWWDFPKSNLRSCLEENPLQALLCVVFYFFNALQQHIMTEINSQSRFLGGLRVWLNRLSEFVLSNNAEVTVEDHQPDILIHTGTFYGRIYIFC